MKKIFTRVPCRKFHWLSQTLCRSTHRFVSKRQKKRGEHKSTPFYPKQKKTQINSHKSKVPYTLFQSSVLWGLVHILI